MAESLLYIQKINALYNSGVFSKSDRLIADHILKNPDCIQQSTANELAEASGTSPATVVRFCRKLGYSGLSDMKMSVKYSTGELSTSLMELSRNDPVPEVRKKVIQFTKMVLDQLNETLSDEALSQAAQLISDAHEVVIVGEGGSGCIARAAYDIFLKLTIPCKLVTDPMFDMMAISMMRPDDVLLVVVNSGRSRNMIYDAQIAHENHIPVIGIVGPSGSPISQYLDVEIATSMFQSEYFSDLSAARICELLTVSILHSIIAISFSDERLENGRRAANAMERKRIPFKPSITDNAPEIE